MEEIKKVEEELKKVEEEINQVEKRKPGRPFGAKTKNKKVCSCTDGIVELKVWKEEPDAKLPKIAYEGTSACFDLYAQRDIDILPNKIAKVPVGVRLTIPEGYYIEFATRSKHGFIHDLEVFRGIIDHGFSESWDVKVRNLEPRAYRIKKGEAVVQCKVHKVPQIKFTEINKKEFDEYRDNSVRGDNGFGSSD